MLKTKRAKPIILDCMKRLNPNLVLDLGCGKCKFSRLFIDRGTDVAGVDKKKTVESKDNLTFIQKDIKEFEFNKKYDLIVGTGILHFLKRKEVYKLLEKMQENTISKGFHFLICMSNEEKYNDKIHFYPDKEELNKLYPNWKIIQNELCLSKKHGKELHQHKMIIFLAKKM